jgi:hypothetical protein
LLTFTFQWLPPTCRISVHSRLPLPETPKQTGSTPTPAVYPGEASATRCRRLIHRLGQPCSGHQHLPTQTPLLLNFWANGFQLGGKSTGAYPSQCPSCECSVEDFDPASRCSDRRKLQSTLRQDLLQHIHCSNTYTVLAHLRINRLHHWYQETPNPPASPFPQYESFSRQPIQYRLESDSLWSIVDSMDSPPTRIPSTAKRPTYTTQTLQWMVQSHHHSYTDPLLCCMDRSKPSPPRPQPTNPATCPPTSSSVSYLHPV